MKTEVQKGYISCLRQDFKEEQETQDLDELSYSIKSASKWFAFQVSGSILFLVGQCILFLQTIVQFFCLELGEILKLLCVYLLFLVQSLSPVWLFVTPWTASRQASLFFTISQSLCKLMSIESVMPSKHLILCHLLLLLPSIFPSIRVFSNESALNLSQHQGLFQWVSSSNQVAKVLEFQLQHCSSQWILKVDFL